MWPFKKQKPDPRIDLLLSAVCDLVSRQDASERPVYVEINPAPAPSKNEQTAKFMEKSSREVALANLQTMNAKKGEAYALDTLWNLHSALRAALEDTITLESLRELVNAAILRYPFDRASKRF